MSNQHKTFKYLFVFILSFYGLGIFFPNQFWSTHFITFLNPPLQFLIYGTISLGLILFFFDKKERTLPNLKLNLLSQVFITLLFIILFSIFPQKIDFYGDSYKFNSHLPIIPTLIPSETNNLFFSFSLSAWAGEGTVLALITYIAYFFQVTYKTAFIVLNAVFGGLYIFTWLSIIKTFISTNFWKFSLILAGLTAPFLLLFFGHIEIYAPVIFINLIWLFLAILYSNTSKKSHIIILCLTLLINLKLHTIGVLCIPALGLIIWNYFKGYYPTWKQITGVIIAPIFTAGILLYFFILKDHLDNRSLQTTALAYDHLFLPLFSPQPPLDAYNLFSFNHIFDYFSMVFLWSPLALLITLFCVITYRKKMDWNTPKIKISGLSLFLLLSLFFVINPLLGIPIDWDLFSIPAVYLLMFCVILVTQIETEWKSLKVVYASLLLSLFTLPIFLMHQSEKAISLRLEVLSKYTYSTYYEWTSKIMKNALAVNYGTLQEKLHRRAQLLLYLKPKAKKDIDYEYAALLIDQGRDYLRKAKNPKEALIYLEKAQVYHQSKNAKLLSLEAYFSLKQFNKAFEIAQELVVYQFPNEKRALRISIHTALEANKYNEAFFYTKQYLSKWSKDPLIKKVYLGLKNKKDIDQLKLLFQR